MKRSVEQQFLEAYDNHADAIFRFCYAQTGKREVALDLAQDAFVKTWAYLADGKQIEQMRPFLYRTARNAIIDRSRKAQEQSLDVLLAAGFDIPDEHSASPAVSAEVGQVIRMAAQLEPQYREAVLLRHVEGLSPGEIADITGENENTVSVRIHRGMQQLRELLGVNQ